MSEEYFPWVIHDGGKSFVGVVSGDYLQGEALIDGETRTGEGYITKADLAVDLSDAPRKRLIKYRIRKHPQVKSIVELMEKQDA